MAIQVILEMTASNHTVDQLMDYIKAIIPDTRKYPGYININVLSNLNNSNEVVLVETWDSKESYENYFVWRSEQGVFEKLAGMIIGEPRIRFLKNTEI